MQLGGGWGCAIAVQVCGVWGVAECSRGGQGAGAGNGAAPREKSIVTEIDGSDLNRSVFENKKENVCGRKLRPYVYREKNEF